MFKDISEQIQVHNASVHRPIDWRAVGICLVLCFIWGLQQTAMKGAAADIPPIFQVAIRSGIAAVLLLLWNRFVLREKWNSHIKLRDGVLVGLAFAGEFLFVSEGLRFTSASHMSVLLYTAPLFAAIGLAIRLPEERLSRIQWIGLLLAFIGMVVAFLLPAMSELEAGAHDRLWLLGDALGLLSGVSWGLTTIFLRSTSMNEATPTQMLFWELLMGFVVLFPAAFMLGEGHFQHSLIGWSSLLFQIFIVSFFSYLVWCALLKRYLASQLGVLVFVTPFFGVVLSVWLLDETVGWSFIAGSFCVLAGLLLVQGAGRFAKKLFRRG